VGYYYRNVTSASSAIDALRSSAHPTALTSHKGISC